MRFKTDDFNTSDEKTQTPKRVAIPISVAEFTKSLNSFEEKITALKNEFQVIFNEHVKTLFDAVPDLESFKILQYTPYFNDGDTCEFSVHSVSFYNTEDAEHDWDDDFTSPVEQQALKDAIRSFIYNNQDLMKSIFDDHVIVTITRDRIETEEYEHE